MAEAKAETPRVEVTRDGVKNNVLYVPEEKKDSAKSYRFIAKRGSNVDRQTAQGWKKTEADKDGKPMSVETFDSILCERPKEVTEAKRKALQQFNDQRENAAASGGANLQVQAADSGMRTFKSNATKGNEPGHFGKQKRSFAMPHNPLGRQ